MSLHGSRKITRGLYRYTSTAVRLGLGSVRSNGVDDAIRDAAIEHSLLP